MFVLMSSTPGDTMLASVSKPVSCSSDRSVLDKIAADRKAEADRVRQKLPEWAVGALAARFEIVEIPDLSNVG